MVAKPDLIPLACDSDLVQAGISVACLGLAEPVRQTAAPEFPQIRERIAQICLDLAFRRYLNREGIPHRYLDHTPFSAPQHQDIALGGRGCLLVPSLITRPSLIERILKNPVVLLESPLPQPPARASSVGFQPEDLLIFGFLLGTVTPSLRTLQIALAANQPVYLLHWLPTHWRRPKQRDGFGTLALKNDSNQPITLELAGQGAQQELLHKTVNLPPGEIRLDVDLPGLTSLRTRRLPTGTVSLHSLDLAETHRVHPIDWGNLWIYGEQIVLAGYLTGGEYQQAAYQQRGTRLTQQPTGWLKAKSRTVATLKPLPDLFARVKTWGAA